jgi:hypothetical protein
MGYDERPREEALRGKLHAITDLKARYYIGTGEALEYLNAVNELYFRPAGLAKGVNALLKANGSQCYANDANLVSLCHVIDLFGMQAPLGLAPQGSLRAVLLRGCKAKDKEELVLLAADHHGMSPDQLTAEFGSRDKAILVMLDDLALDVSVNFPLELPDTNKDYFLQKQDERTERINWRHWVFTTYDAYDKHRLAFAADIYRRATPGDEKSLVTTALRTLEDALIKRYCHMATKVPGAPQSKVVACLESIVAVYSADARDAMPAKFDECFGQTRAQHRKYIERDLIRYQSMVDRIVRDRLEHRYEYACQAAMCFAASNDKEDGDTTVTCARQLLDNRRRRLKRLLELTSPPPVIRSEERLIRQAETVLRLTQQARHYLDKNLKR